MPSQQEIDEVELDRELVRRRGLHEFTRLAWSYIESGPFVDGWHIALLSERLEALMNRQIRKLIVNEPPGCMKSRLCAVLYPAWCWAIDPSERFMFASFDQDLSNRDARDTRSLVMSQWFQDRWPILFAKDAAKKTTYYQNEHGGWRFSTSIPKGKGTGRHPHQRWIDDPIKPQSTIGSAVETKNALEACINWYKATYATRAADPATVVDGLMMQRLHDGDLSGYLLAEWGDDVEHVMLPMEYEPERAYSFSVIV